RGGAAAEPRQGTGRRRPDRPRACRAPVRRAGDEPLRPGRAAAAGAPAEVERHAVRVARLPDGTVTFLFSDIEGSTRLLLSKGDEYAELLADQRRLLRSAFAEHHGVEVDTQGDAFFIAFAKATDAAAAGLAAQAALASAELRVRIGLHTGEPTVTDEGYVGIDVHRAARIMSAGHGGQIIASARTTSFLGGIECLDPRAAPAEGSR